jgi:hypothetical protein
MEFRLVVECENQSHPNFFMTVDNRHWSLTAPYDITNWTAVPEYTCISYIWGSGRASHPLDLGFDISDNTLPSLSAAISNNLGVAFWIDAFCIPADRQKKHATLESMGFIYSRAKQVVVVFSRSSFAAIEQMVKSDQLDDDQLEVLNRDEWVKSVWTYQEVVNSSKLICISADLPGSTVNGSDFLNRVGYSLHLHKKRHNLSAFDINDRFPNLSALEDLVADWMISGYLERSAMQVMAAMDLRVHRKPTHRLYAMIGAVSHKLARTSTYSTVVELAELFMSACEEKNDYSFIYSAAPRDTRSGKRWRPLPCALPAILPWISYGSGQRAYTDSSGRFWLEDMITIPVQPSSQLVLSPTLKEIIVLWTDYSGPVESDEYLVEHMFRALKRVGFKGSEEYMVLEDGLFFPLHDVLSLGSVLVATGVRWPFGAPGLLVQDTGEGMAYVPGVFVGPITVSQARHALLAEN